MELINMIFAIV